MVETELKPSIIRRTNLNYFYFEKKKKLISTHSSHRPHYFGNSLSTILSKRQKKKHLLTVKKSGQCKKYIVFNVRHTSKRKLLHKL